MEKPYSKTKTAVRQAPRVINWIACDEPAIPAGVYWNNKENKWIAQACHQGKKYRIGSFKDMSDAGDAYREYREIHRDGRFTKQSNE